MAMVAASDPGKKFNKGSKMPRVSDWVKFSRDWDIAHGRGPAAPPTVPFNVTEKRFHKPGQGDKTKANLGPGEYNIGVRDMVHELSTRLVAKNVLKHDLTVSQRYDFTSDVPGSPTNPGPGHYEVAGDWDLNATGPPRSPPPPVRTVPEPKTRNIPTTRSLHYMSKNLPFSHTCSKAEKHKRPYSTRPHIKTKTISFHRPSKDHPVPFFSNTQRFHELQRSKGPEPGAYNLPNGWLFDETKAINPYSHQSVFKESTGPAIGRASFETNTAPDLGLGKSHYVHTVKHDLDKRIEGYKQIPQSNAFDSGDLRFSQLGTGGPPAGLWRREARIERAGHTSTVKRMNSARERGAHATFNEDSKKPSRGPHAPHTARGETFQRKHDLVPYPPPDADDELVEVQRAESKADSRRGSQSERYRATGWGLSRKSTMVGGLSRDGGLSRTSTMENTGRRSVSENTGRRSVADNKNRRSISALDWGSMTMDGLSRPGTLLEGKSKAREAGGKALKRAVEQVIIERKSSELQMVEEREVEKVDAKAARQIDYTPRGATAPPRSSRPTPRLPISTPKEALGSGAGQALLSRRMRDRPQPLPATLAIGAI